jgi:hypothetical protein
VSVSIFTFSLTEGTSGEHRDDSSGDARIGLVKIGMKFVIAVGDNRPDDTRIISEQERSDGTGTVSNISRAVTYAKMAAT